ncbi:MAG TPA: PEP-CTERM sorting domain-containing protein [Planctomycetota bacterium]|nr:PEP-CTERM sorting domain-containing protein [Planctomycetota bacterium]
MAAALVSARAAHATLIASDSFLIGSSPAAGEYQVNDLAGTVLQNPTIPGFSGTWKNGTTVTGTWDASATGLSYPNSSDATGGGAWYNSTFATDYRRVYRSLSSYTAPPSPVVFYFSGLLRLDSNADLAGASVAGFVRNNTLTDAQFFNQDNAKDVEGLMWGFRGNGETIDLILRHRYDPNPAVGNQGQQMLYDVLVPNVEVGETYFIVAKLEANVFGTMTTGNDLVSIWINPDNLASELAAGTPDFTFIDFALSTATNIQQLVFAQNYFGNQVSYDELRLGTTWDDVVPTQEELVVIPEPASFVLLLGALGALRRRRRRS